MSNPDYPAPRGGISALLFLLCVAAGGAALAFDLLNPAHGFWIGAQPGARAVIGAGAAVFVLLAGHGVRLLLARPLTPPAEKRDV